MTAILINGIDIGTNFGWYADDVPRWLDGTTRLSSPAALIGRMGSFETGVTYGPRELQIAGTIRSTTVQLLRDAEHQIRDLLHSGNLTIQVNDGSTPTRIVRGSLRTLAISPLVPSLSGLAVRVAASFLCGDPTWRSLDPYFVAAPTAATRYSLPLGTAPSNPIINIMGSSTNPVITYRNAAGTAVWTLTITLTLAATNDWLKLDCTRGTITKSVDGTVTTVYDVLTSGQSDFPRAFDPQDGDYTTSQWPTIDCSSGSAEAIYHKRYL